MKFITVKGNHYDLGFKLGKLLKEGIENELKNRKATKEIAEKLLPELKKIHTLCKKSYPEHIKGLEGISEGSGIDYWRILLLNSPELRSERGGCSTIVTNDKIFHNEDGDKGDRREDFALVKFIHKKRVFSFFVYPGELGGTAFSWNSDGLFYTVNYVKPHQPEIIGIPRYFAAHALIYARTLKEALQILKKHPSSSGFHYYIGKRNKIISVETNKDKISSFEVKGLVYHTNHYTHPKFRKFKSYANSSIRFARIKELIKKDTSPLKILFDTENRPDSIFSEQGDFNMTVATVVFDSEKNKVFVYDRPPKDSLNLPHAVVFSLRKQKSKVSV